MEPLPELMRRHPETYFLVDEAFIGLAGRPVAAWVPRFDNLLVTRTFSKAHSLAGLRIGYAILPEHLASDLNAHNDAYPLARPSQAAALATLAHEDEIRKRSEMLRGWARELAAAVERLGARVFPSETYFFLADFAPLDAADIARQLAARGILVKPLGDPALGSGFMRVTTALPRDNQRFLEALAPVLGRGDAPSG
jgi:histidinol-phosphate aminotransferase